MLERTWGVRSVRSELECKDTGEWETGGILCKDKAAFADFLILSPGFFLNIGGGDTHIFCNDYEEFNI